MPKIGWGTPRTETVRTISESSTRIDSSFDSADIAAGSANPGARPLKDFMRKDSVKMFSDAALLGEFASQNI